MHALKLCGTGKDAVIDIYSCDADKIQRVFKEILNYAGINMEGGISHYIQRALNTREHYPYDNEATASPIVGTATNVEGVEKEKVTIASAMAMLTIQVRGKGHIIKIDKYDTGYKNLYSWIWTMCTKATCDKIKGLKAFATLDRAG